MERTRRDTLRLAGLSLTALSAGCLGERGLTSPTATLPDEMRRVDEPPSEIDAGECEFPDPDRDPLYLCANMPAEPSLAFEQATTRGRVLADEGLEPSAEYDDQMYATLLTEPADRERVPEGSTGEPADLIRDADFDSEAVLVVQTGWGSGSVVPHIRRVESTETGIHAFGCHTDPCIQTDDITSRTVVVRVERPEPMETAVVSLTVGPEERWNVAAGEGVVTIPGG